MLFARSERFVYLFVCHVSDMSILVKTLLLSAFGQLIERLELSLFGCTMFVYENGMVNFMHLIFFRVNLTWTILFSVSFSLSRSLTLSFLFLSRSIFWSAIWFKSVNLLHLHTDVSKIAVICLSFWLPFIFFPRFYLSLCSHSIDTWCLIFFVLLSFVSFPFFLFNGINCIQIMYSLWLLCVRCGCCCFVPPSSPSKFLYTLEFSTTFTPNFRLQFEIAFRFSHPPTISTPEFPFCFRYFVCFYLFRII